MPRPTALITGANKGLGIARQLGERGYSVWIGARDVSRGGAATSRLREAGFNGRSLILDMTDDASFCTAADHLSREVDAGRAREQFRHQHRHARPREEPIDDVRAIFEVNAFGRLRVSQAFLPLLAPPRARAW